MGIGKKGGLFGKKQKKDDKYEMEEGEKNLNIDDNFDVDDEDDFDSIGNVDEIEDDDMFDDFDEDDEFERYKKLGKLGEENTENMDEEDNGEGLDFDDVESSSASNSKKKKKDKRQVSLPVKEILSEVHQWVLHPESYYWQVAEDGVRALPLQLASFNLWGKQHGLKIQEAGVQVAVFIE